MLKFRFSSFYSIILITFAHVNNKTDKIMSDWEKLIQRLCENKAIKACKTSKEVRKCLHNYFYSKYKGKVSDGKINAVIDDILESVCLKLNIDN